MYSKIYEYPECPDDAIIEDDDALDGWMLNQQKKIRNKNGKGVDNLLGKKGQKAQEVSLAKNEEEYEAPIFKLPQALQRLKLDIFEGQKYLILICGYSNGNKE